jgi:hypothetical protein
VKEGTLDFFINPKECRAAYTEVNHAHHRPSVQTSDTFITHNFLEHSPRRWGLFLDRVGHQSCLQYIEWCHSEACERPGYRAVEGIYEPGQLNFCLALVLAKCKQLDLSHLEYLVEGKLN